MHELHEFLLIIKGVANSCNSSNSWFYIKLIVFTYLFIKLFIYLGNRRKPPPIVKFTQQGSPSRRHFFNFRPQSYTLFIIYHTISPNKSAKSTKAHPKQRLYVYAQFLHAPNLCSPIRSCVFFLKVFTSFAGRHRPPWRYQGRVSSCDFCKYSSKRHAL